MYKVYLYILSRRVTCISWTGVRAVRHQYYQLKEEHIVYLFRKVFSRFWFRWWFTQIFRLQYLS